MIKNMKKYNKVILVTGGYGFIGSHLIEHLVTKYPNYLIVNYDKLTYASNMDNLENDVDKKLNYVFVKGDICDFNLVKIIFEQFKITDVIHLAAESHVDNSLSAPLVFEKTNVGGTLTLLQVAKEYWEKEFGTLKGHRFHHVSTDEVYGMLSLKSKKKFVETMKYDPHSPYSASKASSDHFVRAYFSSYGMETTISNCSNNYGPHQHKEKLIPTIINCLKQKKNIPIYGDGKNIRDWLYVTDHAKAIDLIFHKGQIGETYNVGGNCEKNNLEMVNTIIKKYAELTNENVDDLKKLITFVEDRKGHDLRYAIDSSKIEKKLGWKQEVNFDEGMIKTIKWYLK